MWHHRDFCRNDGHSNVDQENECRQRIVASRCSELRMQRLFVKVLEQVRQRYESSP